MALNGYATSLLLHQHPGKQTNKTTKKTQTQYSRLIKNMLKAMGAETFKHWDAVLGLAGMELTFPAAAHTVQIGRAHV